MRPLKITSEKTRRNLKKVLHKHKNIFGKENGTVAVEGLNGLRGRHIGRICIMVSLDLIFISVQRS